MADQYDGGKRMYARKKEPYVAIILNILGIFLLCSVIINMKMLCFYMVLTIHCRCPADACAPQAAFDERLA